MTDWAKILKKKLEDGTIPSRRSVQELIDDGEYGKALIIANLNVKKWPKNPDFLSDRGDVLLDLGRFREAIVAYKKALKLDPKDTTIIYGLVLACSESDDFEECIKWINKLPSDQISQDILVMKADCLSQLGKSKQSLEIFQNLWRDDPTNLDLMEFTFQVTIFI